MGFLGWKRSFKVGQKDYGGQEKKLKKILKGAGKLVPFDQNLCAFCIFWAFYKSFKKSSVANPKYLKKLENTEGCWKKFKSLTKKYQNIELLDHKLKIFMGVLYYGFFLRPITQFGIVETKNWKRMIQKIHKRHFSAPNFPLPDFWMTPKTNSSPKNCLKLSLMSVKLSFHRLI